MQVHHFTILQAMNGGSNFPTSSPIPVIVRLFFGDRHPGGYDVLSP